jgi:hypothetical protein
MRESIAKLAYEKTKKIDWAANMNMLCEVIKNRIGEVN